MTLLPALVASVLLAVSPSSPRRFLLAVGQNEGEGSDVPLQYAESDARSVARVFQEAGSVPAENAELLLGATSSSLAEALQRLSLRLQREARPSDQLFIYISSHADEGELHLRGTRFRVAQLRDLLNRAPVGVAVLVLDACRSGAATRAKGLRALPTVIRTHSPGVRGRVVITSSGPNEAAQESDRIHGSYFTSHWVAGLRGMADVSGDGRVTLQEAYTYAYERTIASTFSTAGGIQHPNFQIELRGEGELVLSEPHRAQGQLVIEVTSPGEYLIRQENEQAAVAHFYKPEGGVQLALSPGRYQVLVREQESTRTALLEVSGAGPATLRAADLTISQREPVARKGPPPLSMMSLSASAAVGKGGVNGLGALFGAGVRLHGTFVPSPRAAFQPIWITEVNFLRGSSTLAPSFTHQELSLSAGAGVRWESGRFAVSAALEGGALWTRQWDTPLQPVRDSWAPVLLGVAEGQVRIWGPWAVSLSGWAGPAWLQTQAGSGARFRGGLGLGIALRP